MMSTQSTCTPDTLLRKLKLTTVKSLAHVLDVENELSCDWRRFASLVPKRPGSTEMKYDMRKIQYLEHKLKRSGSSPTESIIQDLGTVNMQVKDIVKVLEIMGHHEAIKILLPEYSVPTEQAQPDTNHQIAVPEFDDGKIHHFTFQEVIALTANFNAAPLLEGGRKIGEGGFGAVFLGYFKNETKCAVKKLFKEELNPEVNILQQLQQEVETLLHLKHKNLVKIYGYCLENLCLVLEYIPEGNLCERLACEGSKHPLSWKSRVSIATGSARGINFLHNNNYIHRDVKSANILLDTDLVPKIVDFGLVRRLPDLKTSQVTSLVIGTNAYLAPECLAGNFSYKADVYSFGVVLLEIITGQRVFDKNREGGDLVSFIEDLESDDAIINEVDKKAYPYDEDQVKKMYDVSSRCIQKKKLRPEMDEVYKELAAMCNPA